ncbi:hypothetical protein LOAG_08145, partial [Loa loa]
IINNSLLSFEWSFDHTTEDERFHCLTKYPPVLPDIGKLNKVLVMTKYPPLLYKLAIFLAKINCFHLKTSTNRRSMITRLHINTLSISLTSSRMSRHCKTLNGVYSLNYSENNTSLECDFTTKIRSYSD